MMIDIIASSLPTLPHCARQSITIIADDLSCPERSPQWRPSLHSGAVAVATLCIIRSTKSIGVPRGILGAHETSQERGAGDAVADVEGEVIWPPSKGVGLLIR